MGQKFPVSYSRWSTFDQCQLKFEYLHVAKTVKDYGNEHTEYGHRVHKSLEKYGRTGDTRHLTYETRPFKQNVDSILAGPGEKYFEYQLAVDANRQPCEWFSKSVWIRAILDVLVDMGDRALVVDWKTGKVKDDPTQMQWFAAMVFALLPDVQRIDMVFAWLAHKKASPMVFHRNQEAALWAKVEEDIDPLQTAVDLGVFEPKPSKLCGWCPAKNVCPYS